MINLAHYYRQTRYLGELPGLLCLDSWPHEHHLLVINFATFATKAYCLIWCFMIPSVFDIQGEGIADSIYVCGDNPRDCSNVKWTLS